MVFKKKEKIINDTSTNNEELNLNKVSTKNKINLQDVLQEYRHTKEYQSILSSVLDDNMLSNINLTTQQIIQLFNFCIEKNMNQHSFYNLIKRDFINLINVFKES